MVAVIRCSYQQRRFEISLGKMGRHWKKRIYCNNKLKTKVATDELYKQCGYINGNGCNKLHSELQTIINNQELPSEVLEEVENFIKEMEDMDSKVDSEVVHREGIDAELVLEDKDAEMPAWWRDYAGDHIDIES